MSLAGNAQNNNVTSTEGANNNLSKADSLRMDSIIHSLPDVMVKGHRPIVKVKGAALTYDLPQLIKNHPVDNAYEAIKQLPGVSEQDATSQFPFGLCLSFRFNGRSRIHLL